MSDVEILWIARPAAVLLIAAPLVAANASDKLVSESCRIRDLGVYILGGDLNGGRGSCATMPLLSDLPSLAIWLSCVMSVLLYQNFSLRDSNLSNEFKLTGLLPTPTNVSQTVGRKGRLAINGAALTILTVVGVFFYDFVARDSPWFSYISSIGSTSEAELANSWWASAAHPASRIVWIGVGVVGGYFALLHVVRILDFAIAFEARVRGALYVPSWRDPDHGWSPVNPMLVVIALGFANFGVAFTAISYLFVTRDPSSNWVLLTLAIVAGGIASNFVVGNRLYRVIRREFASARRRQVTLVSGRLDSLTRQASGFADRESAEVARLLADREEMRSPRHLPFGGVLRAWPAILVGLLTQVVLLFPIGRWLISL